jgi:hypothetical protein
MRMIPYAITGAILATAITVQAESGSVTGRFQGTGRACYGTLSIDAKTLSWLTPFSHCKSMAYQLLSQERHGGKTRMTYRLTSSPANCRFAVLSLTHGGPGENTGWEVTGYGAEQSYLADKASGYQAKTEDMMSCYLVRAPDE